MAVGNGAFDQAVKFTLNLLGNRPDNAVADADLVNRTDRGDLGCSAAKENFVGDVEHFARDHLLNHWNIAVLGDANHRIAGDARQHRISQRRSVERPMPHHE